MVRDLLITNKRGLHARAAARFVKITEQFDAEIAVEKDGETVSGARGRVNQRGDFVIFTILPPNPDPQVLELELFADGYEGGIKSTERVFLASRMPK